MTRPPDPSTWRRKLAEAVARNSAGHPASAEQAFTRLIRTIEQAGDCGPDAMVVLARAHLGRAVSSFDQRADRADALADIAAAADLATAAGAPQVLVAVHGQRGLLYLRSGETARALAAFDDAVRLLDRAEPFDQMRILINRGALHMEHGRLAQARGDLTRCIAIAVRDGDRVVEFKARHNLGYVEFLAGNLPRALTEMAAATAADPGGPWPTVLLDKARVLREAGLTSEAEVALASAEALFRADHVAQDVAETLLSRAECALPSAPAQARELAHAARRVFRRRGNARWELRADLLALSAELAVAAGLAGTAGVGPARRTARRAALLADRCASEGRHDLERSARLLALDAQLRAGGPPPDDTVPPLDRRDPLGVRLQARGVRARLAAARGDAGTARAEVRRGLEEAGAYQARFGSLDMRTASALHGVALARLDLDLALRTGRPAAILASIERTRAASSRLPPVQPPPDDAAAALLAELRLVEEEARGLEGVAGDATLVHLRARAAELRSAVRATAWRREGTRDARAVRAAAQPGAVRARLDAADHALVDLVTHDGRWHAVVLDGRRLEHHVLSPVDVTDELVRRTRSDLDALALPMLPPGIRDCVRGSLAANLEALDRALLTPLRVDGRPLVVAPTGLLAVLPWSLLPSRRGLPVCVAPSAAAWAGLTGAQRPGGGARVAAVAGPGLCRGDDEAHAVADAWSCEGSAGTTATTVTGADAGTAAVVAALGGHDVVHVAAHGRHEPESPLFSSLRLADGPLFAHELESAGPLAPCLLLSACDVGQWTVRPGNEPLGLTSALLHLGARSVVAGIARVGDAPAADVMVRLHRLMAGGTDSATALAVALDEAADDGVVAPFVCFGAAW